MLPRSARRLNRAQIRHLLRRGQVRGHATLTVWRLEVTDAHSISPQLVVIVSKKVSRRAHERQRLKRQLRACLRSLLPQLPPTLQLALSAKPRLLGLTYAQIEHEVHSLLSDHAR